MNETEQPLEPSADNVVSIKRATTEKAIKLILMSHADELIFQFSGDGESNEYAFPPEAARELAFGILRYLPLPKVEFGVGTAEAERMVTLGFSVPTDQVAFPTNHAREIAATIVQAADMMDALGPAVKT